MVYRKRRYNRRYKNKTKKFNKYAYAKTDSKNQAKQIVRLNKKISNVYKSLRGEIKKNIANGQLTISNSAPVIVPLTTLIGSSSYNLNDLFKGVYTKFIYENFKFFFNSGNIDLTQGKTLRVIIVQNRNGLEDVPLINTILNPSGTDTTAYMIAPFKNGINNNYKILLNKTYTISSDRDYLYKSYNFKKLIGYNKISNASVPSKFSKGSIFIIFITTQTTEFEIKWNNTLGYIDSGY